MKKLFDSTSRLLNLNLESSGSLFVGSYLLQLILYLSSQMVPHIPDLVAAMVRCMQSVQIAGLRSSLLLIFARLIRMSFPNDGQLIDLLITNSAEGHNNLFVYLMSEWTKLQGEIQGAYQIKVTTSTLALILSTQHAELAKINVQGYLVKSSTGITTRSKAKSTPDQWTVVPLPVKILALLADALIEIQEQVMVNYKVDGFRFDLMGHIMKSTMLKAKEALQSLTKDSNGVDGSNIYIYDEGRDFGEVPINMRGINASQFNLFGTGIGSFNDRIQDAILGGSPVGHPLRQGFVTGLLLQPNGHDHGTEEAAQYMLGTSKDHIQVGMAANLRDYVLSNFEGNAVKGYEILTHDGSVVVYVSCPTETINYASAHDNETLFDVISLKDPLDLSMDARCMMNYLVTSTIAFSQGIPFIHAGDELLRSKSMDRDSYNSGDWFNMLDFTYTSDNWWSSLPRKEKIEKNWSLIKQRHSLDQLGKILDPDF